jgi:hypothetical protein
MYVATTVLLLRGCSIWVLHHRLSAMRRYRGASCDDVTISLELLTRLRRAFGADILIYYSTQWLCRCSRPKLSSQRICRTVEVWMAWGGRSATRRECTHASYILPCPCTQSVYCVIYSFCCCVSNERQVSSDIVGVHFSRWYRDIRWSIETLSTSAFVTVLIWTKRWSL